MVRSLRCSWHKCLRMCMSAHAAPALVLSRCASSPQAAPHGSGDACASPARLDEQHRRTAVVYNNYVEPLRDAGCFTALLGKVHFDPIPPFDYLDEHTGNRICAILIFLPRLP